MNTAQAVLKDVYLGVLSNELNNATDPFLNIVNKTNASVYGRNIVKLVPYGINSGINASDETDALPEAVGNKYLNFVTTLKNLYGSIEISDKAIRASNSDKGAFVNLLNAEMESLLASSKFNLARMLFGNGSGELFVYTTATPSTKTLVVNTTSNVMEGMVLDVYFDGVLDTAMQGVRIVEVNHQEKKIVLDKAFSANMTTANAGKYKFYMQNAKDQEITGLGALFGNSETLYGLKRADYNCLKAYSREKKTADTFNEELIQSVIDVVEFGSGSQIDLILADSVARGKMLSMMATYRRNIDVTNMAGGMLAMSYNGIPVIKNRFCEAGSMLFLNTKDFELHQLCDWEWLSNEDGAILKQKENYAIYQATLVKYADLICARPNGQAKLSKIN